MSTILITAFEPFGGQAVNASAEVLKQLPDRIGGHEVRKLLLPVVFGRAAEKVEGAYDRVFLLGEAGRETVTPETTARNIRSARIPDNDGHQPQGEKILEDGPDEYRTAIPAAAIVERMIGEGCRIAVSDDAGTFVCNDTFYLVGMRQKAPVEFIHVPNVFTEEVVAVVRRFIELAAAQAEA